MGEQTRSPSLYVVATPIGNLADITLRAVKTLQSVAMVAAEDTRVTTRLLRHYSIDTPLIALHEHNERRGAAQILDLLAQGKSVALVTDAGTPAISDPGALAVSMVRDAGYSVIPIPGANAAICALSVAGTRSDHFLFYGFLPPRAAARVSALETLRTIPYPVVFYEAPHRIIECVDDMAATLGGERSITIARELTKMFESIHSCKLGDATLWLRGETNRSKGEFVVLVEGAPPSPLQADETELMLKVLLAEVPLKQAVKIATQLTGIRKNVIYEIALKIKEKTTPTSHNP